MFVYVEGTIPSRCLYCGGVMIANTKHECITSDGWSKKPKKQKEEKDMNDKLKNEYVEDGLAIFIKGHMVIGIHPDNLENNIQALSKGIMSFDWKQMLENASKK